MTLKISVTGGSDFGFICIAAFRYALGRMTYAPGLVTEWLKTNEMAILDKDWRLIQQETKQAIDREAKIPGSIGHHCDLVLWRDFLEWMKARQ